LGGDGTIGLAAGNSVNISAFPGELSPGSATLPYTPPATPSGYAGHAFDVTYSAGLDPATVGTLTVSGDVNIGGYLLIDLVNTNLADMLDVNGDVTLGPTSQLEINGETDFTQLDFESLGLALSDRLDIVTADSILGNFSNMLANREFVDAAGNNVFFGNDGSSIFLQAVPEPASIAAWIGIGLTLLACGRRVRRTKR
jgi:hypothetical protein